MSYGATTKKIHKNLRLDRRENSSNWQARMTLKDGRRIRKSTGCDDLETATENALNFYYETNARIANSLPATTRKFKAVAEFTIARMQRETDEGGGRQAFRDYIQALNNWLTPYFEKIDIEKIDLAKLTAFDAWRTEKMGRIPAQSTINNHNAALNRVLDEAELNGWIVKSFRPTLLNKGAKGESRGGFTAVEYKKIYEALRTWDAKTSNIKARATRKVLRNYVLFLANTGVRHGTEALGLRWRNIEWHENDSERYLIVNVDGKTKKRSAVARDRVETYLDRQRKLNNATCDGSFDELIAAKSDEFVFTTCLGKVANIFNLNRAFNALLDELKLKVGADDKARTLYSWRHYYATQDLKRGVSTHALSRQMGNSTEMLDKHYSNYSPIINAGMHSGREWDNERKAKTSAKPQTTKNHAVLSDAQKLAFSMLENGKLSTKELLAVLGVDQSGYKVTAAITMAALAAKGGDLIDSHTLMKIQNGSDNPTP